MNTFLPLPIIWSYHFWTIFRGVVESKSEKVGEVKLKNFKKQPCIFEALQQKTEVKKRKEKREKRASEVVGYCRYLLVTVVFKKNKNTWVPRCCSRGIRECDGHAVWSSSVYGHFDISLSLLFTISDDLLLFSPLYSN